MTDTPNPAAQPVDLDALEALARAAMDQSDLGSVAYWNREVRFSAAAGPLTVLALIAQARSARQPQGSAVGEPCFDCGSATGGHSAACPEFLTRPEPALHRASADVVEALKDERDGLRAALIAAGRHAGCLLADDVSSDFLSGVPREVEAVLTSAQVKPDQGAPDAESAGLPPREPTEAMLNGARDWSVNKYGQGVGNKDAIGCWQAMYDAALAAKAGGGGVG